MPTSQQSNKDTSLIDEQFSDIAVKSKAATQVSSAAKATASAIKTLTDLDHSIKSNLGWASIFISAFLIPLHFMNFLRIAIFEKLDGYSRALQLLGSLAGIGLGIVGILVVFKAVLVATPILVVVGAGRNILENLFQAGINLYQHFLGTGRRERKEIKSLEESLKLDAKNVSIQSSRLQKLTDLKNQQRERKLNTMKNIHGALQATAAIVGGALLFTPIAPVGIAILATVTIYGALDYFGLNPFVLAAKGVNHAAKAITGKPLIRNPFKKVSKEEVLDELGIKNKAAPPSSEIKRRSHETEATLIDKLHIKGGIHAPAMKPDEETSKQPGPAASAPTTKSVSLTEKKSNDEEGEVEHPHQKR